MKKSTIVYLIVGVLSLIIFLPISASLIIIALILTVYLFFCFLEIYGPYSLTYSNEYFGHAVIKPKHNIIYKLSKLIDGKDI